LRNFILLKLSLARLILITPNLILIVIVVSIIAVIVFWEVFITAFAVCRIIRVTA